MKLPRIEFNLAAKSYRESEGVSKSELDTFAECPAKYHAEKLGIIQREETSAMSFGTLLHSLVLDGKADYFTKPDGMTFASKDGKAWRDEHQGKPIITTAEHNELIRTSSAILKHRHAGKLFGEGSAEVSMYGQDKETGLIIKGRADWLAKNHLADLKTIRDASNKSCAQAISNYHYHWQAYLYREIARQNGFDVQDFYFIFLERGDFPLLNVRKLSPEAFDLGEIQVKALLREYKTALDDGIWLDYSGDGDAPGEINLPPWSYKDTTGMEEILIPAESMDASELDLTP